jgi:hypothetical protein
MDDQMDDHASSRLPAHSKERNMILKVTTSAFLEILDRSSLETDQLINQSVYQSMNISQPIQLSIFPSFFLSFLLSFFPYFFLSFVFSLFFFFCFSFFLFNLS